MLTIICIKYKLIWSAYKFARSKICLSKAWHWGHTQAVRLIYNGVVYAFDKDNLGPKFFKP